jgi:Na+/H+ antiporter NhaD/arsenite permease-like protein
VVGYFAITTEHFIKVNKAATALITGVLCWTIYICYTAEKHVVTEHLAEQMGEMAGILFFLLGAMTIVELIDAHNGFDIITRRITQTNKRKLLWIISLITFFLSPILDNLTTTIVMVSMVRVLVRESEDRLFFVGMIIIAANAGGAWSPIGDVTTTMLWIGGQVTAYNITTQLLLPALFCLLIPLTIITLRMHGTVEQPEIKTTHNKEILPAGHQKIVFFSGVLILCLVPVFKAVTHLPPFMGVLVGLGILWIITEVIHVKKDEAHRRELSVASALQKIDTPSILFFLGILLSIAALQVSGLLGQAANWMTAVLPNENAVVLSFGVLSSVIDNVPLVAAVQGMYSLEQYPTDHYFWEFLAYATGSGGSALIIGSAAGVAAMGLESISFFWYLRKMTIPALCGFFGGAGVFLLQHYLTH